MTTDFWMLEEPQLDQSGRVVRGGMWSHQQEWWRMRNFVKLLVTGYGGGKTLGLCKRLIALCISNAPEPGAVVSPSFPMARKTVIPTMLQLCRAKQAQYPQWFRWRHNKSDQTFTVRWGEGPTGLIYVLSGDDPERLKGPNLSFAGIDEPFIQEEAVFDQMLARVRVGIVNEILLTGTPEQLNWGYDVVTGEWADLDVGCVQASTRENRALSPDYVRRLEAKYDDLAVEAYVEGKFVNLSRGVVFRAFTDDNVVALPDREGAEWFVGMDFNVCPMAFVVGWLDRRTDHIHFEHEYELENSDTEDASLLVRERHPQVHVAYPDPTGTRRQTVGGASKSDHRILEDHGFEVRAPRQPWSRRDSFNAVNGKCRSRDGRVTLSVNPRCKRLIKYARCWTHQNMNTTEGKQMSHLLDAFRYAVTEEFPIIKEDAGVVDVIGA